MNLVANLSISKKGITVTEPSDDVAMGINLGLEEVLNVINALLGRDQVIITAMDHQMRRHTWPHPADWAGLFRELGLVFWLSSAQ